MADHFPHLSPATVAALALSVEERLAYLDREWWIGYDKAKLALAQLERIYSSPRQARPLGGVLVGVANNGKTSILNRFKKLHPPEPLPDGSLRIPVLSIDFPKGPDERSIYQKIIEAVGVPYRPNEHTDKLRYKAFHFLVAHEVKVLLVDDFNNMASGSAPKQRVLLNLFKEISNSLKLSIVCAGTQEALLMMQLDSQFSSRFPPLVLPLWKDGEPWQSLLATFEQLIPLPVASNLAGESLSQHILAMSERTIGDAWQLLTSCARYAISNGNDCITRKTSSYIGWVMPSKRIQQGGIDMHA